MPKKKSEPAKPVPAKRKRRAPIDLEVEVKIPCHELEVLTESGLQVEMTEPRHFEDNWVYKLPDGKLRKGQYLRIRYSGNSDGAGRRHEGVLTYKGKSRRESEASKVKNKGKKVREEIESTISHPTKIVKIFKRLGLKRSFRYQKYRSIYRVTLGDGRALLAMFDETPLGNFLELEGEADAIEAVAAYLGFSHEDFVVESYVELQHALCAARGIPLADLIFDKIKKSKPKAKRAKVPKVAKTKRRKPSVAKANAVSPAAPSARKPRKSATRSTPKSATKATAKGRRTAPAHVRPPEG